MQGLIFSVLGLLLTVITASQVSPSIINYVQSKKAESLVYKEQAIYDAINRYTAIEGSLPTTKDDLVTGGYISASMIDDNGWGNPITFAIDGTTGVITIDTNIPNEMAKKAYLNSSKNFLKPVIDSDGSILSSFVIPQDILKGGLNGVASGATISSTAPNASTNKFWYDTSSGTAVLKISNGTDWVNIPNSSQGLPTVSSTNTVSNIATLPTTGVTDGDIRYVYNATNGAVDTYVYYGTGWQKYLSGGTATTTTPTVVAQGYRNQWHIQDPLKTTTTTDITGLNVGATLPYTSYTGFNIVTTSRVYYVGGTNGNGYTSNVLMATINSDGTLGTFATTTALPSTLYNPSVVVTKNRVYLISGYNGSSYLATVLTAPINSDGTLGSWSSVTSLPSVKYASNVVVTKNRVYLLGGHTGSATTNTVFTAPINDSGAIGTWETATALPTTMGRQYSGVVVVNNKAYVIGGYNGSAYSTSIFSATIDDSGMIGTWSEVSLLPATAGRYASAAIATSNRVFLMGGYDGSAFTKKVFSAPIDSNGNIGTWVQGTSISGTGGLTYGAPMVTKNRVFIIGGHNGSNPTNEIYSATFDGWEINKNEHTY